MSEVKFTRGGEWVIRMVDGKFAIMRHDTGYGICSTVMRDDTDKANAHLIAAAPSMYAALESILMDWDLEPSDMDWVESLLAKARGE